MASAKDLKTQNTLGAGNPVVSASPRKKEVPVIESVGTPGKNRGTSVAGADTSAKKGAEMMDKASSRILAAQPKKQGASEGSSALTRMEARKQAQAAGKKEFTWNGTTYDTRWGGEVAAYKQSRGEYTPKAMVAKKTPTKPATPVAAAPEVTRKEAPAKVKQEAMPSKPHKRKEMVATTVATSAAAGAGMKPKMDEKKKDQYVSTGRGVVKKVGADSKGVQPESLLSKAGKFVSDTFTPAGRGRMFAAGKAKEEAAKRKAEFDARVAAAENGPKSKVQRALAARSEVESAPSPKSDRQKALASRENPQYTPSSRIAGADKKGKGKSSARPVKYTK